MKFFIWNCCHYYLMMSLLVSSSLKSLSTKLARVLRFEPDFSFSNMISNGPISNCALLDFGTKYLIFKYSNFESRNDLLSFPNFYERFTSFITSKIFLLYLKIDVTVGFKDNLFFWRENFRKIFGFKLTDREYLEKSS